MKHIKTKAAFLVLCTASQLIAEDSPPLQIDAYIGVWCGADETYLWQRTVHADGTYTQFNEKISDDENVPGNHSETGMWSIQNDQLITSLSTIQFIGEETQTVGADWPALEFRINHLTDDQIEIEHVEFGLTFVSTRDCGSDRTN